MQIDAESPEIADVTLSRFFRNSLRRRVPQERLNFRLTDRLGLNNKCSDVNQPK